LGQRGRRRLGEGQREKKDQRAAQADGEPAPHGTETRQAAETEQDDDGNQQEEQQPAWPQRAEVPQEAIGFLQARARRLSGPRTQADRRDSGDGPCEVRRPLARQDHYEKEQKEPGEASNAEPKATLGENGEAAESKRC